MLLLLLLPPLIFRFSIVILLPQVWLILLLVLGMHACVGHFYDLF